MTVNVTITTTADPAHFEQWDSPTPGGTLTLQGAFAIGAPAAQVAYATQLREIRVAATELLPPPYSKNPPPPPPNPGAVAAVRVHAGNYPVRVQTWLNGVLQGTVTVGRRATEDFQATPTQEIRVLELLS